MVADAEPDHATFAGTVGSLLAQVGDVTPVHSEAVLAHYAMYASAQTELVIVNRLQLSIRHGVRVTRRPVRGLVHKTALVPVEQTEREPKCEAYSSNRLTCRGGW